MRDLTVNHFHTDPVLVQQNNVKNTLKIGQLVYQDSDGLYKPAIATGRPQANVQGIVWNFINNNTVYIKTQPGPLFYRFPFIPDWFEKSNGIVIENALKYDYAPGAPGTKLFLSDVIEGAMTNLLPTNLDYVVLVGFRTDYGVLFHMEPYCSEIFKDS